MVLEDLTSVKDDMIAFIAGHGLRRMNAYVSEDVPTVIFEADDADSWKDFVEHAKAANAPFLTMSEVVLEPEDIATLMEQVRSHNYPDQDAPELHEAQQLTEHVGKTGYLQLGFSSAGVMYLFETATDWYETFQTLMETLTELGHIIVDDTDDD
jgi:hypothetical protein